MRVRERPTRPSQPSARDSLAGGLTWKCFSEGFRRMLLRANWPVAFPRKSTSINRIRESPGEHIIIYDMRNNCKPDDVTGAWTQGRMRYSYDTARSNDNLITPINIRELKSKLMQKLKGRLLKKPPKIHRNLGT